MTARVTVESTPWSFDVEPTESILDAALRQGVPLQYGCRRGKCSTCKHLVVDGQIDDEGVSAYALLDEEREEGFTLLCQAFAVSDCVIELADQQELDDVVDLPVPREVGATIIAAQPCSRSIWTVTLDLHEALPHLPGQYVEVEVPGHPSTTRPYSIASAPSSVHRLELAVKRIEGGCFSGQLEALATGTATTIRGPFGGMYLRPGSRTLTLIGAGSGIGPLIAIVRGTVEQQDERRLRLFYGARSVEDLPYRDALRDLAAASSSLELHTTLSSPSDECGWTGPLGRVNTLVARTLGDEIDTDVYVCGPPEMCDAIILLLESRGIRRQNIHSDAFYPAA